MDFAATIRTIKSILIGSTNDSPEFICGPLYIDIEIADDVADNEDSMCSVCLERYRVSEGAVLLICGHFYHTLCYSEWSLSCTRSNIVVSCPECRR